MKKIISGGQTGADIAAIDAAIACCFPYGGTIPKGRKCESGTIPEAYDLFSEAVNDNYNLRTAKNVRDSDITLIFTYGMLSGGSKFTRDCCDKAKKKYLHINLSVADKEEAIDSISRFIRYYKAEVVNVAGSRASKSASIYSVVRHIIEHVIADLRTQ